LEGQEGIEAIAKAGGLDLKRILENKLEMVCPAVIVTNEGADIEFCHSMLNDDYVGALPKGSRHVYFSTNN
jgi:hypothetical protein